MKMHYIIRGIAGTFVLASLVLGYLVSPWWLLFTAFVGLNLLQSSLTRWCLMEDILAKLGVAECPRDMVTVPRTASDHAGQR
jgi:hypothetical protein